MRGVYVSMKSGLEGRNNIAEPVFPNSDQGGLNEVRPRRPEQSSNDEVVGAVLQVVSMKSGLEGRNNHVNNMNAGLASDSLNEVRPRRPEQWVLRGAERGSEGVSQ